jgi:hypothetical protein
MLIQITLGTSPVNAQSKGNNMSLLQDQPVFELKLDGYGCMFIIYINDIKIHFQNNSDSKINTTFPINHYMRSGSNEIKLSLWSGSEEPVSPAAYIKAELIVSEHKSPETEYTVTSVIFDNKALLALDKIKESTLAGKYNSEQAFSFDDKGDITINEISYKQEKNVHVYNQNITIPSSLPLWAFFSSDTLPDYYGMSDDEYYKEMDILLLEYQKIQNAIVNKDIASALSMFKERNTELDQAFYYPVGTYDEKVKKSLTNAANDETAELVELNSSHVDFRPFKNQKLNSLKRHNEQSAIRLNYTDIEGSYGYHLIFRRENGNWILTR